jgi:hypothetical protein
MSSTFKYNACIHHCKTLIEDEFTDPKAIHYLASDGKLAWLNLYENVNKSPQVHEPRDPMSPIHKTPASKGKSCLELLWSPSLETPVQNQTIPSRASPLCVNGLKSLDHQTLHRHVEEEEKEAIDSEQHSPSLFSPPKPKQPATIHYTPPQDSSRYEQGSLVQ